MPKIDLYEEFLTICSALENAGVRYALVGGIAVSIHAQPRFTKDIDILVDTRDFELLRTTLSRLGYDESAQPWSFSGSAVTLHRFMKVVEDEYLPVGILCSTRDRYLTIIGNAISATWEKGTVMVAGRDDIIWMKQQRNSLQDQADIENLRNDSP